MMQENRSGRQAEIHITQMRRNPYLVDYQTDIIVQCPSRKTESANRNRKLRLLYLMETYAETIPTTRAQDNA